MNKDKTEKRVDATFIRITPKVGTSKKNTLIDAMKIALSEWRNVEMEFNQQILQVQPGDMMAAVLEKNRCSFEESEDSANMDEIEGDVETGLSIKTKRLLLKLKSYNDYYLLVPYHYPHIVIGSHPYGKIDKRKLIYSHVGKKGCFCKPLRNYGRIYKHIPVGSPPYRKIDKGKLIYVDSSKKICLSEEDCKRAEYPLRVFELF